MLQDTENTERMVTQILYGTFKNREDSEARLPIGKKVHLQTYLFTSTIPKVINRGKFPSKVGSSAQGGSCDGPYLVRWHHSPLSFLRASMQSTAVAGFTKSYLRSVLRCGWWQLVHVDSQTKILQ